MMRISEEELNGLDQIDTARKENKSEDDLSNTHSIFKVANYLSDAINEYSIDVESKSIGDDAVDYKDGFKSRTGGKSHLKHMSKEFREI